MAVNKLIENDQIISDLRGALRDGQSGLKYVPKLLHRVLLDEAWRERYDAVTRQTVRFGSPVEFVTAAPTEGLGATVPLIDKIIADGDPDLLRLWREAKKVGQGRRTDLEQLPVESTGSYGAERSDYTVDRLAREAPDEYEAVKRGEKSIHAAAIAAGIRKRRMSVRMDSAESAVETLRKHMPPEQLARLRKLLADEPAF